MTDKGQATRPAIRPGSPAMETFLQAGYPGMTAQRAEKIIKEAEGGNTQLLLSDLYRDASAFLAAYNARNPQPTDPKPGWKRKRTP